MKIGITGCAGRMGRMVTAAIAAAEGCVVAAGSEAAGSPALVPESAMPPASGRGSSRAGSIARTAPGEKPPSTMRDESTP